jgi:hypothetical protein
MVRVILISIYLTDYDINPAKHLPVYKRIMHPSVLTIGYCPTPG